jgi:hypothetical protein
MLNPAYTSASHHIGCISDISKGGCGVERIARFFLETKER